MEKKRLLIAMTAMELGGAERSLIGLLSAFDYSRVAVDLFLYRQEGELLPAIPSQVRLLPELPAYTTLAQPIGRTLKNGHFLLAAARVRGKRAAAAYCKRHSITGDNMIALDCSHRYTKRWLPPVMPDTEYDLAISFITPHYIVAEKVRAKHKAAFIHTDYTRVACDRMESLKMWDAYDTIFAVSEACGEAFCKTFPSLEEKVRVMENILPAALCRQRAQEDVSAEMPPLAGGVNICSVGRFCYAKNFDHVPVICRLLKEQGLPVRWYLIGFGGSEQLIRDSIREQNAEDMVVILGKKPEPYPYMRACDLYVQPSRYEGKSVTVREAQMLGKPVIIAAYETARSQLRDGYDGLIAPQDDEGMAAAIAALASDKDRQQMLSRHCLESDYSNAAEVDKLYQIMG